MKYTLIVPLLILLNCAHLKPDDNDTGEIAAAELDKVSLYRQEFTAAPAAGAALPSQYLRLGDNLVVNGSFESPVLSSLWATYGNAVVSPWQASWVDLNCTLPAQLELQSKDLYANSPDENQYAELDTNNACTQDARITLKQSFATAANHIYRLSFWVRARDTVHKMGLSVNLGQGYALELTPVADGWQIVTVYFEATATTTTLAFTDTGDGDTYGTLLDAVDVREVTVDMDTLQRDRGSKGKGPGGRQSFAPGRRHKDCNRGR